VVGSDIGTSASASHEQARLRDCDHVPQRRIPHIVSTMRAFA